MWINIREIHYLTDVNFRYFLLNIQISSCYFAHHCISETNTSISILPKRKTFIYIRINNHKTYLLFMFAEKSRDTNARKQSPAPYVKPAWDISIGKSEFTLPSLLCLWSPSILYLLTLTHQIYRTQTHSFVTPCFSGSSPYLSTLSISMVTYWYKHIHGMFGYHYSPSHLVLKVLFVPELLEYSLYYLRRQYIQIL